MLKNFAKPFLYLSALAFFLSIVISCEEDFTDIGTTIVSNNQFTTNDTLLDVFITGEDIQQVQADGLRLQGGSLGQYLLGVYNNGNYEKIEASIVSQVAFPTFTTLQVVDDEYGADTTVVTTIDTVLLRLPYQATLIGNDAIGPEFELDSVIGDQLLPWTLNVFRLETFLNDLNPANPAVPNTFYSDQQYDVSENLSVFEDFQFTPNRRDTAQFVLRRLSNGDIYQTDTIRYPNANPYISIPLKKDRIKEIFLDEYGSAEFASQDAFNNYFRGIKIQAEGNQGALISLDFNNQTIQPVIDIYYTNTVLRNGGTQIVDTINKRDTFTFSGEITTSEYKMTPALPPTFNRVAIQGAAGTMAKVNVLGAGQLDYLRTKNWLINDATLTLYVDKTTVGSDTIGTPRQLFLHKEGLNADGEPARVQILDALTEGIVPLGGFLTLDDDRNPDFYTFKITDYVSELAAGRLNDLQPLGITVFNPTDLFTNLADTIISTHNWNPKAVMLLNHEATNGSRKATLRISYSARTEQNN